MSKQKKVENYVNCDASEDCEVQNNSNSRPNVTEVRAIELFHKNISVGPEYICTWCDQLWYRSSVTECNASSYKSCSQKLLNFCLTGLKSIDNTKWICSTCHSNLKAAKLPTSAKANKIDFLRKA